jgi:hypothetical protein
MDDRRDIGRIGTLARVIGGTMLVAVPIAEQGISWWDAAGALIALPLVAFAVAGGIRLRRSRDAAAARTEAIVAMTVVIAIATVLTFVTPIDQVAIWSFFGVSVLLAALRGYAGCELLAIPNALTGRRDELDCFIYTPIDTAEALKGRPGAPKAAP